MLDNLIREDEAVGPRKISLEGVCRDEADVPVRIARTGVLEKVRPDVDCRDLVAPFAKEQRQGTLGAFHVENPEGSAPRKFQIAGQ